MANVRIGYSYNRKKPIGIYVDERPHYFADGEQRAAIEYLRGLERSNVMASTDIHVGIGLQRMHRFFKFMRRAGIAHEMVD